MAKFLIKTKGNADPSGKRKIYFTCHPDDFSRYFEKICEDIFRTHDCAIYYTEDMNETIDEEDKATDLGQMNLFVISVTFRLLSKPNRAMDSDIAYAKSEHIPILPLMMETGIDEFYGKPEKFGELQYLSPYSKDISEIGYENKLKKYLESVLISDEMVQRIREAFDAYIFLSYRKKDRRYANDLMRLIHGIPEYRDIAIWYDEFLTPGESFRKNIEKALQESKLFALLVTPSLLEDPNFVMTEEYPAAKNADMTILPTEMVETNKDELRKKYKDIPECADPKQDSFRKRFLDALEKVAISKTEHDPKHNFLIGLAYLDGIDMELDRERGLELITSAAESGVREAMVKLYDMYFNGKSVRVDYGKSVKWAEQITEYDKKHYGEEHPNTLNTMHDLAGTYGKLGDHKKALELQEKVYTLRCKFLGEEHLDTLKTISNLAGTYGKLGNYKKEIELEEKVYTLCCKILGEEHLVALIVLNNLAQTYKAIGDYKNALELQEKDYTLCCRILGDEHPDTLISLDNLAVTYGAIGDYKKELALHEKAYILSCKILGDEHPDTLKTLNNLAITYVYFGDYKNALKLGEKSYTLHYKILGKEHPDTLVSLNNLATAYGKYGDHKKELELTEKVYDLCCKILGDEHPDTLTSLNNLATTCFKLGDFRKALEKYEQSYALHCKVLGEKHPNTKSSLINLISICNKLGQQKRAMILSQKLKSKSNHSSQKRKSLKK